MGNKRDSDKIQYKGAEPMSQLRLTVPITITLGDASVRLSGEQGEVHAEATGSTSRRSKPAGAKGAAPGKSKPDNEWYTSVDTVDPVREFFGGQIDLDPASCAEANRTVGAARFFGQREDGLKQRWKARNVFLNPPYRTDGGGLEPWLRKAMKEYSRGNVSEVIMLMPCVLQSKWFRLAWKFPMCFLHDRLAFRRPGTSKRASIIWSHVLIYIGPDEKRFTEAFAALGRVVAPCKASAR